MTGMLLFFVPPFGLLARFGLLVGSFCKVRFLVSGVFGGVGGGVKRFCSVEACSPVFIVFGVRVNNPALTRFCTRANSSAVRVPPRNEPALVLCGLGRLWRTDSISLGVGDPRREEVVVPESNAVASLMETESSVTGMVGWIWRKLSYAGSKTWLFAWFIQQV